MNLSFDENLPLEILNTMVDDVFEPLSVVIGFANKPNVVDHWPKNWPRHIDRQRLICNLLKLIDQGDVDVWQDLEDPETGWGTERISVETFKKELKKIDDQWLSISDSGMWFSISYAGRKKWEQWQPPQSGEAAT
jgi:hypothetical protein